MLVRIATWIAAALALGWLATAVSALVLPGGHPPAWFVLGEGVVLVSYLIAPVGLGAAAIGVWRSRKGSTGAPRRAVAMLAVNALLLSVAVGLGLWIWSEITRR